MHTELEAFLRWDENGQWPSSVNQESWIKIGSKPLQIYNFWLRNINFNFPAQGVRNKPLLFYSSHSCQSLPERTYLQLPLRQWGASKVYLLVLSSWKVNIAKKKHCRDGVVDTFRLLLMYASGEVYLSKDHCSGLWSIQAQYIYTPVSS